MIRIAVLGTIGSGKSFFAKQFKIPLFCADEVVQNLYRKNKTLFVKLKKSFPKDLDNFPIKKLQLINIINKNSNNLKKITKIVHPIVRKEMQLFLKENQRKKAKAVVLDIPLFLENKLDYKTDILVFIDADQKKLLPRLKRRKNFNQKNFKLLKSLQMPLGLKKDKADFVVKNNFNSAKMKKEAKILLNQIII
tara:strand:- start:110 stop:688 length:579 start_codon:yes stop_codon:yes gene_type:complete